jgi:hypothetical protein
MKNIWFSVLCVLILAQTHLLKIQQNVCLFIYLMMMSQLHWLYNTKGERKVLMNMDTERIKDRPVKAYFKVLTQNFLVWNNEST